MVRESLTEIFAEIHLEKIVEGVISNQRQGSTLVESISSEQKRNNLTSGHKPQTSELKKKLGISEQEWQTFYSNIGENTIKKEETIDPKANRQYVSEKLLESNGLMKDYSHLIK